MTEQLGGGFNFFKCSPLFGEMIKLDDHMFSMGLVQPPTRQTLLKMKMHLHM